MALLLPLGPALAEDAKVIAIAPLSVNADRDLTYLQKGLGEMLASRLAWEGKVEVKGASETASAMSAGDSPLNPAKARTLGLALGADYVLFGSVTVFGDAASLDVSVVETAGTAPALTFSRAGKTPGDVIPQVDSLAAEISSKVFGKPVPRSMLAVAAPVEPAIAIAPQAAVSPYTHPEKLLTGPSQPEPGPVAAPAVPYGPPPARPGAPVAAIPSVSTPAFIPAPQTGSDMWKSPTLSFEAIGLALADTTGDGLSETVVIGKNRVAVYRFQEGRFATLADIARPGHLKQVWVDAADINGNGRAEIFVSAINANGGKMESFVLEWNGKDYAPIAENERTYFRVISVPGRGQVLFGQRRGAGDVLLEGIYELTRSGEHYESKAGGLSIPKADSLFGAAFGEFADRSVSTTAVLGLDDYLRLYDSTGKRLWMSDEKVGGSEKFLNLMESSESANTVYTPQRLIPISQGDRQGILVVMNTGMTGRLLSGYRRYTAGTFSAYFWDGLGMTQAWSTRKVTGLISDYGVGDVNNDGKSDLVFILVKKSLTQASTNVVAFDMDSAPTAAK